MIWGSQWDAIMNWFLTDNTTKDFVTAIRGNHEDKVAKTGEYTDDLAKNIFDMSGNIAEWTQEGENTSYRNMRGGAAMTTADKYIVSTSGRYTYWRPPTSTTVPTNTTGGSDVSKNYLGSRMTLYINNTEDTTVPELTIDSTNVGTNNIEVKVTAKDEESGISKYRYSVSLKNFEDSGFNEGTDVIKKEETYGNSYTFTGLNDNQTYYIRVEAINGVGQSTAAYAGPLQTEFLEIAEGAIIREKVYGKNGEGTAYFTISKDTDFEDEGYYLQYQIGKSGAAVNIGGTWTKGDTVRGLSVGDIVYTRLYDGVNVADYYMSTNISELETFSDVYQTTTKYDDYDTVPVEGGGSEQQLVGTAYIPAGFKVATSDITKKIANGLVIEDEKGNQFVWIPVKDVVYDGKTAISSTYKPMFKYQSGYSEDTAEQYFERIYYSFSGTTSSGSTGYGMGQGSYREPTLVTNSTANYSWVFTAGNNYDATLYTQLAELGIDSPTKMGTYLNDKYTDMVESIKKYGGYYVGRHETSLFTEAGANSTSGTVVKSVQEETPMASVNWYKMYLVENSDYEKNPYHTSSSVTSQMITGGQWDTMLNFILQGSDKEKVTAVTGNHTGTRSTTGQFGSDIMNNIFDLSSNVREWTTEASGATGRTYRGGYYGTDGVGTAGYRSNDGPAATYSTIGSRLSLYLK